MMTFLLPLIFLFVLTIISCHAQNQTGFVSIDCGLPDDARAYSDDSTGIDYVGDKNYVDSGENRNIARNYQTNSVPRHLWTVRSFPESARNCYNLSPVQGKGKKYLIRATFMYGNYDGENRTMTFDLHLGVEVWDTVTVSDSTSVITKEIIHVPISNYFYVCLVNSGKGVPFISALELRPLEPSAYQTDQPGDSLLSFTRWNFAPVIANKVIRFPDDIYDRLWQPSGAPNGLNSINTTEAVNVNYGYQPPETVMQTALTSPSNDGEISLSWSPPDPNVPFYAYMYFAEVVKLQRNESRTFEVNLDGERWYNGEVEPDYLSSTTIYARKEENKATFSYSLVRDQNSTLPPLINALETYSVKPFSQSQTNESDVEAILNIKSAYGVNKDNWQGDPCLPQAFRWDGLDCIVSADNTSEPPRIKSLNLSSSGLTGNVSLYLSNLTSLENLDLSNNNLNGPVPEFLAELPRLKFLNLSGNQFSGSIPQNLLEKAASGLELRADGYSRGPCEANQCNKSNKSNKFVVPLVASLTAFAIVLAALIAILTLRRRKAFAKLEPLPHRKDGFLVSKNMQYTYSDILKMTNNFQRVIGKGGFGTVYHGTTADGKQVAVKLLAQSSAQGYNEFQTEAELLTRVHHRNLTILVGYCYEGTHMALVYEYMAYGNLREQLSGDNSELSWSERLHILLDSAQGLDYLHNGCKPPIIHRDVKSTNILINENFEAKLADFGLSRAFTIDDGSFVSTKVVGTPGYLDPEYYETQRLHEKSDIFSFGVVILELITGRPVISGPLDQERRHIVYWVSHLLETGDVESIVDPKLKGYYDVNTVWKALEIAMACASPTSSERPNMARVLTELKDCLVIEKARSEGHETDDASYLLEANPDILEIEIGPR